MFVSLSAEDQLFIHQFINHLVCNNKILTILDFDIFYSKKQKTHKKKILKIDAY